MLPKTCSKPECQSLVKVRGMCTKHYTAAIASKSIPRLTTPDRFWAKVDMSEACWLWVGAKNARGYGQFRYEGRTQFAHRVSHTWAAGPISPEMQIDHSCHNRACVNPAHLREVTHKQNMENRAGADAGSASGARGVSWHAKTGKWRATATSNGKRVSAGLFPTVAEAALAAAEARNELFTHNDLDRIPA